jgi:ABC-type arginine transport system permease subunit
MMPCALNEIQTDFGCFPNDPVGFIQKFYGVGLGFVAGVALLALIYGGYVVMTSRGDPRRVNDGKSWIYYAIAGLMLAIFGYVFIQTVLVDILHVPGFK